MAITSKEINEQGFETAFRGYDIKQVDGYLEYIANEVDILNNVIFDYEEQIEKLRGLQSDEVSVIDTEEAPTTPDNTADLGEVVQQIASESDQDLVLELANANAQIAEYNNKIQQMQTQIDTLTLKSSASAELDIANAKIKQLEEQLAKKQDDSQVITKAYISAQRGADELVKKGQEEGARIYKEAEESSKEFIKAAMAEKQKILIETAKLKDSCDKFRLQYKEMLEKFSLEAQTQFAQLTPPVVSEADVAEVMPESTYKEPVSDIASSAVLDSNPSVLTEGTEDTSVIDIIGQHEVKDADSSGSFTFDSGISDLEEI